MNMIVQVYVRLIREGRRTLDSVPEPVRPEVEAALNEGAEQQ
ncbi:CD1375 family protein [Cohnella nanjingensis]|uniref:ASCH domain-containing protein n=1 Tax=Cohnella nanjingensis TaxID=1387779 RepID=A0A7X0RMK0_9BACL|nr:CD1375 family protein [Cohnella nanjingensis]MBB6670293.1 ASCH domain-containing protein [Cohnella nanjingensis]